MYAYVYIYRFIYIYIYIYIYICITFSSSSLNYLCGACSFVVTWLDDSLPLLLSVFVNSVRYCRSERPYHQSHNPNLLVTVGPALPRSTSVMGRMLPPGLCLSNSFSVLACLGRSTALTSACWVFLHLCSVCFCKTRWRPYGNSCCLGTAATTFVILPYCGGAPVSSGL